MPCTSNLPLYSIVGDSASGAFLTPGSGKGKKSGSGSGMKNPPGSYFREHRNNFRVKIYKFFDADPGWKKFGSGMEKIRFRDKHPGSATLLYSILCTCYRCYICDLKIYGLPSLHGHTIRKNHRARLSQGEVSPYLDA
jgi:hypothetical protein